MYSVRAIGNGVAIFLWVIFLSLGSNASAQDATSSACEGAIEDSVLSQYLADEKASKQDKVEQVQKYLVAKATLNRKQDYADALRYTVDGALDYKIDGSTDDAAAKAATLDKVKGVVTKTCTALQGDVTVAGAVKEACQGEGLQCKAAGDFVADKTTGGNSEYSMYLGAVYSLEGDGGWHSGAEASLVSRTKWFGDADKDDTCKESGAANPWFCNWSGLFEATYSSLGQLDGSGEEDSYNPFDSSSGIFRINVATEWMGKENPWWGAVLGGGFTTRPRNEDDTNQDVDLRKRGVFGLITRADYGKGENGGAGGRVILAVAKDDFWKWHETAADGAVVRRDESWRVIIDSRIDAPGVFNSKSARLSFRLYADAPMSGKGPSDVRISILLNADIGRILGM